MATQDITVAVLGTGLIGAGVARNLAKQGFQVRAWNRTASKAVAIEGPGLSVFDSVAAAVEGASYIVTVLKDGASVAAALEAGAGHFQAGALWLQLSTVGLVAIEGLSRLAEQQRLVLFDAPVQGSRQPAEQGQLLVLASGPLAHRAAAQAIFDAIGKRTIWVSEQVGQSSRLKLALNNWVFALTHGLAESLALAESLDVDPAVFVDAISGGPLDCGYFQFKSQAMREGNFTPSFSVANAVKDAQLIGAAARAAGLKLPVAEAGLQRLERVLAAGHGEDDIASSVVDPDRLV